MDWVGAADDASQSLTKLDSEALADPDSQTEVTFPLSLALAP